MGGGNSKTMKAITTKRECLAVLIGLREFKPYLRGSHVTIYTDHAALKWILTRKYPPGQLVRWLAYMQSFNFTVIHKPGAKLPHADCISRQICENPTQQERKLDHNSLITTDDKIVNNAVPLERTETDGFIDNKLMMNSMMGLDYFHEVEGLIEKGAHENQRVL
jgi:hypothetical protein